MNTNRQVPPGIQEPWFEWRGLAIEAGNEGEGYGFRLVGQLFDRDEWGHYFPGIIPNAVEIERVLALPEFDRELQQEAADAYKAWVAEEDFARCDYAADGSAPW